ncbi:DUF998 domain-containing protein [Pseudoxanthomonas suwonensis]|uniref:DUF998 domain-containing protein n=1 Tax=Pseudoxanthomonas suwonensis TaxID=314722 RepID=UPI000688B7C7|nr:DUF998 domain-containing protein [Pseudoxanthomonas suwonensis]
MRDEGNTAERRTAWLVIALVAAFAVAAIAVQALRREYDWWHAPLSFYLAGPHGGWLVAAYCLLGAGLAALALAVRDVTAPAARYALTPALFVGGGASLVVTAFWPGSSPGHPADALGELVHGLSAVASFLLVGLGMLLQSLGLLRDPGWRGAAKPLVALAALAFIALWTHVLWRELPRGASQKAVIALYLLWALLLAWRLRGRATAPESASAPASRAAPEPH